MSAHGLNSSGGSDSAPNAFAAEAPLPCPPTGQAGGGASAFWLTVAAGTAPSHLSLNREHPGDRPETRDLVTREIEMSNPDLLRLFKQQ